MRGPALVLGATGFIGGHVALAALEHGWEVRGFRRRPDATGHLGGQPIRWYEGDIDRPESILQALEDVDTVFHVAGYYPVGHRSIEAHVAHSVQQTRGVLASARGCGVRRLVYTSTLSTIGLPPAGSRRMADERDVYAPGTLPGSSYYECKIAMENEVLGAEAGGLDVVVANPTLVLGPGDVHLSVGRLVLQVAKGRGLAWMPGETNVIDVRDAARAHIAAAGAGESGQRYILGGANISIKDLIGLIAERAGVRGPRVGVPGGWLRMLARLLNTVPWLRIYASHLQALSHWQPYDVSKAAHALRLRARPLEETIDDMIAWYRAQGYL